MHVSLVLVVNKDIIVRDQNIEMSFCDTYNLLGTETLFHDLFDSFMR